MGTAYSCPGRRRDKPLKEIACRFESEPVGHGCHCLLTRSSTLKPPARRGSSLSLVDSRRSMRLFTDALDLVYSPDQIQKRETGFLEEIMVKQNKLASSDRSGWIGLKIKPDAQKE